MKGFKFRLESVLNYRRFQKRQCEAQLSLAVKKRQEALTLLEQAKVALREAEASIAALLKQPVKVSELVMLQRLISSQRAASQVALSHFEAAGLQLDKAREGVLDAQTNCKRIEHLKVQRKQAALVEQVKLDELQAEEFVRAKFAAVESA
jgi:flagellar export protein FliJ